MWGGSGKLTSSKKIDVSWWTTFTADTAGLYVAATYNKSTSATWFSTTGTVILNDAWTNSERVCSVMVAYLAVGDTITYPSPVSDRVYLLS